MKLVTVEDLKEGDVLARDVLLEDYTVLLGKGTILKNDYIRKLKDLSIVTVSIEVPGEEPKEEITIDDIDPLDDIDFSDFDLSIADEVNSIIEEQKAEEAEVKEPEVEEPKVEEKAEPKKKKNLKKQPRTKAVKVPLQEITMLQADVEKKIKNKVRDILELHVYQHTKGLEEIAATAENIISDLLEEPAVVEKVYDVRERNADIYEHSLTTCTIATLVALKLKMPEKDVYDISVSALLHDLGLRYLVVKYEDQDINLLSKKDQEEYRKHAIYAYTAIKNEDWISEEAKNIILNHHEKKDGSGYPVGTDIISRKCQILGVCDEFDEMICGIGKAKVRVHEAINCIRNYGGIWYDDDIVETFLQLIAVYPVGSKVKTNQGETGVVMRQNLHFPERPLVRIMNDKFGQPVREEKVIDLLKNTSVVIQEVLKE